MNKKRTLPFLLCLLLVLTLLFSSCGARFVYVKNGVYRNEKTDITYHIAPSRYEPVGYYESQKVATFKRDKLEDMQLYAVSGTDGKSWLCDKDLMVLFYDASLTLPTLAEMKPNKISLQMSDTISLGMGVIENSAEIDKVVSSYMSGPRFLLTDLDSTAQKTRYDVKFSSTLYPAFYYSLVYYRFEGEALVYQVIEDGVPFTPLYEGVEVTFEDYVYETVVNGSVVSMTEHQAVYHFGAHILYDRDSGYCYMAGTDAFDAFLSAN